MTYSPQDDSMLIPRLFDAHVHCRQGDMMDVIGRSFAYCDHIVVMPNTTPPIRNSTEAIEYQIALHKALCESREAKSGLIPDEILNDRRRIIVAIKLIPGYTTQTVVEDAIASGFKVGKLYPAGATTNSQDGWSSIYDMFQAFEAMSRAEMILSIHGEIPWSKTLSSGKTALDAEAQFVHSEFRTIRKSFEKLTIILEHITTELAVNIVRSFDKTFATITAHHLVLTLNDVVGDGVQPHNYCKPISKYAHDRKSLLNAAILDTSGKFFLGSDSAPHPVNKKESICGCAGCYTAPILPGLLLTVFEGKRAAFERFASMNGRVVYGLPSANVGKVEVVRGDVALDDYDDIDLNLRCFRPPLGVKYAVPHAKTPCRFV